MAAADMQDIHNLPISEFYRPPPNSDEGLSYSNAPLPRRTSTPECLIALWDGGASVALR